jgi:AraC-like DNA-binding protein
MRKPYDTFTFDWLVSTDAPPAVLNPAQGDVEWLPYPIEASIGEGGFQKIELALNMSVFRGVHRFAPNAMGNLIPLAAVEISFSGPTFMAQVLRGGRILHHESHPQKDVLFSPGLDLFRLTDQLKLVPVLDGSQNSEMTCLTVGMPTLAALVGEETTERLMCGLDLLSCPQVVVRRIPLHVSAHLHGAIGTRMSGAIRSLHCQARMLDYLGALVDEVLEPSIAKDDASLKDRVHAVHELLTGSTGKLPTLDGLAKQFGCSAKRLNEAFELEFGQSIFSFVTSFRLDEAHAAILQSEVPLKKLAERLGYSHVNHFIVAFKRKFGYPPGSLRRRK